MGVTFRLGIERRSFWKVFVSGSRRTPNKGFTSIGYTSAVHVVLNLLTKLTIF